MIGAIRIFLLLLWLVTMGILTALLFSGCDPKSEAVISDVYPVMSRSNNILFIGNKIINEDYFMHNYGPEKPRGVASGRELPGYVIGFVIKGSLRGEFLGGAPTAYKLKLYYGTKEDCLVVLNQINKLMKRE